MVSHNTSLSPSIEGMTTVTFCDVSRGISGMGMGRSLLKANRFTTKRRYRYRLRKKESAGYEEIRKDFHRACQTYNSDTKRFKAENMTTSTEMQQRA